MSMETNTKGIRKRTRYSEAVKREVVEAVFKGNLSEKDARSKYGISGHSTILRWSLNTKVLK